VRLELHPEARAELRSAAIWYDERRPGLGDEFISEISASLDRVRDVPESYPAWPGTRAEGPLIRKVWSTKSIRIQGHRRADAPSQLNLERLSPAF
jgi:hypothetical protein